MQRKSRWKSCVGPSMWGKPGAAMLSQLPISLHLRAFTKPEGLQTLYVFVVVVVVLFCLMEASSHRHDQSLSLFSTFLCFLDNGK